MNLHHGDCLDIMRGMADNSVDSIVTDPPYELGFMGKAWDSTGIAYNVEVWRECLRVLKPGGHLLAFGGSRTYHRMAVAIEDAGFEIRDQIMWVYGSGFPKSHNIGDGRGTALKPSHEPICMARKPFAGTVAANVQKFGTGAINVDACRVGVDGGTRKGNPPKLASNGVYGNVINGACDIVDIGAGRWPANLIHDGSDEVVRLFPVARSSGVYTVEHHNDTGTGFIGKANDPDNHKMYNDTGSAARFFYCAKASKRDRDEGLDGFEAVHRGNGNKWTDTDYRVKNGQRPQSAESGPRRNVHPTVKPTDLMRYLVRLVTPPGGVVLDPFMGSGSTGKAATLEGFDFIGIDLEAEHVAIAQARIEHAAAQVPMI